MRWLVLFALAGCDRVLQLDDITPHDAGSTGDASFRPCPSDGSIPTFTGKPRMIAPGCTTYTVGGPAWSSLGDGSLATAFCNGMVWDGLAGGPLTDPTTVSGTNPHQSGTNLLWMTSVTDISEFTRSPQPDMWTNPVAESFAPLLRSGDLVGSPSTTQQRNVIVWDPGPSAILYEYIEPTAHQWTMAATPVTSVAPTGPGNLSSDGLRLVFPASTDSIHIDIYYQSRAVPQSPFATPPNLMLEVGDAVTPFMTDDCQALYYTSGSGDVYEVDP